MLARRASIAMAALRPAAIAAITDAGPVTASPPAKTPAGWWRPSADRPQGDRRRRGARRRKAFPAPTRCPIARITWSASRELMSVSVEGRSEAAGVVEHAHAAHEVEADQTARRRRRGCVPARRSP